MRTGKHRNVINWTYLIVGGTVGIIGTLAGILAGFHLARDRAEEPIVDVARNLKSALDEAGRPFANTVSGESVDVEEMIKQGQANARPIVSPEKAKKQREESKKTQADANRGFEEGKARQARQQEKDAQERARNGISEVWHEQRDKKIKYSADANGNNVPDVYEWAIAKLREIYDSTPKDKTSSLTYPHNKSGTFDGYVDHFYPLTKATGRDGDAPNGWQNEKVGKLIEKIESRQNTSSYFGE